MSTFILTPPPPPSPAGVPTTPAAIITPPYIATSSDSSSSSSASTSIIIVIIIISSAVIASASIYLLLRFLSRRFHRTYTTTTDDVVSPHHHSHRRHASSNALLDSLPLFTFRSVNGNLTGGDCAVCLSKFEPHDQLRLLPLCCHAFHAECIDTWIVTNRTCPLCRSTVIPCDGDALDKILSTDQNSANSFRIEIGSISRRHDGAPPEYDRRRSYSIGSFDYIVDENGYEVSVGSTVHRRGGSDCTDKESSVGIPIPDPAASEFLAAEVSGGRSWLREYIDRLPSVSISSRAVSFRSSGRFFSGSSRRSEAVIAAEDLEANRAGEEISELFRWLSGV